MFNELSANVNSIKKDVKIIKKTVRNEGYTN